VPTLAKFVNARITLLEIPFPVGPSKKNERQQQRVKNDCDDDGFKQK